MIFKRTAFYKLYLINYFLLQIVYELPTTAQWSFDVAWCPRNPAMVCTSSFDGHVSVFSLMGGGASGQDFQQQKVSVFDKCDLQRSAFSIL